MMQRPICRDCFHEGKHKAPKKTARIFQDKFVSRFGWFWEIGWARGYAFTKSGAIRQAKRFHKRRERGESNQSFEVEL
jgi:hypothetical protein